MLECTVLHQYGWPVRFKLRKRAEHIRTICTPFNVGATSQRMAYSHVCLLMSLLRDTPILDDDPNLRRFIARLLSLDSDLSCNN